MKVQYSSVLAAWGLLALSLGLSGCAGLKSEVLDKNAAPIKHVIVRAEYRDMPAGKKLSSQHLTTALRKSMEEELRTVSNGLVEVTLDSSTNKVSLADAAQYWPTATHFISLDAALVSYSSYSSGTWNSCAYTDKNKKCVGGLVGGGSTPAMARLEGTVTDLKSNRPVVRIDPLESTAVPVADDTPMAAAKPLARKFVSILVDAGLVKK